tara:strand:+ start:84 stop:479 length:396 start_codon:yes stop_codon:yes gene_type:complete
MGTILFIKKAGAWLREYWKIPALVIYTIVMAVVFRRNTQALKETLEVKRESYEAQLKILGTLHEEEILKRDGLIEQYQDIVVKLEADFKKKNKVLEEKHKERVRKVVLESKKNPEEMKKKIQNMFGFRYVE